MGLPLLRPRAARGRLQLSLGPTALGVRAYGLHGKAGPGPALLSRVACMCSRVWGSKQAS